jgi:hypothetical protein
MEKQNLSSHIHNAEKEGRRGQALKKEGKGREGRH